MIADSWNRLIQILSHWRTAFVGIAFILMSASEAALRLWTNLLHNIEGMFKAWYQFRYRCATLRKKLKRQLEVVRIQGASWPDRQGRTNQPGTRRRRSSTVRPLTIIVKTESFAMRSQQHRAA